VRSKIYIGIIEKFGLTVQGDFEPIVSDELFYRVQQKLENKKRNMQTYQAKNPDFPLRGFVVCSSCGDKITGSWSKGRSKKYPYYRCKNCNALNIRKESLESMFINKLEEVGMEKNYLDLLCKIVSITLEHNQKLADKSSQDIEKRVSDLNAKKKAILDKNIKGIVNDDFAKALIDECDQEIRELKNEVFTNRTDSIDVKSLLDKCQNLTSDFFSLWNKLDINGKLKFQWFVFPEGLPFDGEKFRTTRLAYFIENKLAFKNNKLTLVEQRGVEPLTSSVRGMRSPN
jgi:site-specific DNA recombinase